MDRDRLLFIKEGRARFISHLDLMRTFQRAFLRAEIPIKHTEGFNPHPFVSIALPLSVGFSSKCEILEFSLLSGVKREEIPQRLNCVLPEGIIVRECYEGRRPIRELCYLDYDLTMIPTGDAETQITAWSKLLDQKSWVVEKASKKNRSGSVNVDLATLVKSYDFTTCGDEITLHVRLLAQNPGLNPQVLITALKDAEPAFQPNRIAYRRMEILDKDGNVFR